MKLRDLIIRISGVLICAIITIILLFIVAYIEKPTYTYVLNGKFGKSHNCYINKSDFRVCSIKGQEKVVEMYYEEEK